MLLLLLLLHVCIGPSVDPARRRRVPTLHRIAIGGRAHGRRRGSAAASEARGGTPTRMHGCGPLAHARPRHATPPATRHTAPPTTDAAPRLAHAGLSTTTRSRRFLRTPSTGCRRLLTCACGDATHAHARRASIRRACDSYASGGGHRSHARMHRAPPCCCCCCMYASARRSVDPASRRRVPTLHRIGIGAHAHGWRRRSSERGSRRHADSHAGPLTRVHATPPPTLHGASDD